MACPVFTTNGLLQFIDQYKWYFGVGFIVMGIFLGLIGFKVFQVALFMVSTLAVTFLVLFICYSTFLSSATDAWVGWTALGISVVLGLAAGYFMTQIKTLAAAVMAGFGGFLIGILINESIVFLASKVWLFWTVNIACAIVFAILGYFLFDFAVCFGTSFIGSFLVIKGISIMAGGFPSLFLIVKSLENNDIDLWTPVFYAYLAGIIVLTVGTSIFQWKVWVKDKREKEAQNENSVLDDGPTNVSGRNYVY
jgi:hypothetical protein